MIKTRTSIEEAKGLTTYFNLLKDRGHITEKLSYPLYKEPFVKELCNILNSEGITTTIKKAKSSFEINFFW